MIGKMYVKSSAMMLLLFSDHVINGVEAYRFEARDDGVHDRDPEAQDQDDRTAPSSTAFMEKGLESQKKIIEQALQSEFSDVTQELSDVHMKLTNPIDTTNKSCHETQQRTVDLLSDIAVLKRRYGFKVKAMNQTDSPQICVEIVLLGKTIDQAAADIAHMREAITMLESKYFNKWDPTKQQLVKTAYNNNTYTFFKQQAQHSETPQYSVHYSNSEEKLYKFIGSKDFRGVVIQQMFVDDVIQPWIKMQIMLDNIRTDTSGYKKFREDVKQSMLEAIRSGLEAKRGGTPAKTLEEIYEKKKRTEIRPNFSTSDKSLVSDLVSSIYKAVHSISCIELQRTLENFDGTEVNKFVDRSEEFVKRKIDTTKVKSDDLAKIVKKELVELKKLQELQDLEQRFEKRDKTNLGDLQQLKYDYAKQANGDNKMKKMNTLQDEIRELRK